MKPFLRNTFFGGIVIFFITLVCYIPAIRGGFVWDDTLWLTENPAVKSLQGLRNIWFSPGAVTQYYPLFFTGFWVEYHLWGLDPMGYHLVNVFLHAGNAILLWLILRHLKIPGSWFAAVLFALHPVHVESVAWITEQKNVLSGFFYLGALLVYLKRCLPSSPQGGSSPGLSSDAMKKNRKNGRRSRGRKNDVSEAEFPSVRDKTQQRYLYALSLFLFLCALLSKIVACTLPFVILILIWWKKPEILRKEAVLLVPMFILAVVIGWVTGKVEGQYIIQIAKYCPTSLAQKFAIAGQAFWFYLEKLFWPFNLTGIYPRWKIDIIPMWKQLYWIAAAAGIVSLWFARGKIGKAPLAAALFYLITIGPVLGFINIGYMMYSFVADHFQYLASLGGIALFSALTWRLFEKTGSAGTVLKLTGTCLLLGLFGFLSWKQAAIYRDSETFYRDTIKKNPQCFLAWNNLGNMWVEQKKFEEAIVAYTTVLAIMPECKEAKMSLGILYAQQKNIDKAIYYFRQSLPQFSQSPGFLSTLAFLLANRENPGAEDKTQAVELAKKACELTGYTNLKSLVTLAIAYTQDDRLTEGKTTAQRAIFLARETNLDHTSKKDLASIFGSLSYFQILRRLPTEAIASAAQALELDPTQVWITMNLAHGYLFSDQYEKALNLYMENKGVILSSGQTFAQSVLNDFVLFRKKRLTHPSMDEIEKLLRATP